MMGYPVQLAPLQPTERNTNPLVFRLRNTFLEFCDMQSTLPNFDRHVRARSLDSCRANSDTRNWFCTDALGPVKSLPFSFKDTNRSEIEVFHQHIMEDQCMEQVTSSITTIMLRNIACRCTQEEVATILDDKGLKGTYDFIYLPRSPHRCLTRKPSNYGYVFVNFIQPEFVEECRKIFDGRPFGRKGMKLCQVVPAKIQGAANLLHYTVKRSKKYFSAPLIMSERNKQIQAVAEQGATKVEQICRYERRGTCHVRHVGVKLAVNI